MKLFLITFLFLISTLFQPQHQEKVQAWSPADDCYSMSMTFTPHILRYHEYTLVDFYIHCNHGCLPIQGDDGTMNADIYDPGYDAFMVWPNTNETYCKGLGPKSAHYYWDLYYIAWQGNITFDIFVYPPLNNRIFRKVKYVFP